MKLVKWCANVFHRLSKFGRPEGNCRGILAGCIPKILDAVLLAALLLSARAGAVSVGYTGRITAHGQPLNGNQHFKFAVVQSDGTYVWNSDREETAASNAPVEARLLRVTNGVYRFELGDIAAGMRPLDPSLIERASRLSLRVWVADQLGWQQLVPDQPLVFDSAPEANSRRTESSSEAILAELRYLRERVTQLERGAAGVKSQADPPVPQVISLRLTPGLEGEKVLGAATAPLVLLEYTDYQCPFCKRFYQTTFSLLKSNYIDTGKVRFVSRNLPLPGHPQSKPAALAAFCAGTQEKYWEMRNQIFTASELLAAPAFQRWAQELHLDLPQFESCLTNQEFPQVIIRQTTDAAAAGITGTPTFILGRLDATGNLQGELLIGAKPYAEFERRIGAMLAEKK